jgi:DNA-binding NarL/FixJ family response regulator
MPASDVAGITSALRLGIRGIISPDATGEEVENAIRAVWAGFTVTAPPVLQAILPLAESVAPEPFADGFTESLSEREHEVLELLAEGLPNKLIAVGLRISEHTVKTHVASIFAKLGVGSRTEAVSQAIRRGLLML